MAFLRRLRPRKGSASTSNNDIDAHQTTIVQAGNLKYAAEKGGNSEEISYQETSGAPVESRSPLGYHVGAITIVC